MSTWGPNILAVCSMLMGVGASVLMLVLLLASTPNSSPQQLAQIRGWMLAIGVLAAMSLVGSVWALIVKKPLPAAGVGALPLLFCVVSFIVLWRSQP